MNLNKYSRQAIVTAVIADIPRKISLENVEERLQKIIDEDYSKRMHPDLYKVWNNLELRPYVSFYSTNIGYIANTGYCHTLAGVNGLLIRDLRDRDSLSADAVSKVTALMNEVLGQENEIEAIRVSLEATLVSIRTVKQFKERLPELAKYAPEESGKSNNLPAIANVVSSLVKLGWPGEGKTLQAA